MAFTSTDLAAIETAIASGTLQVSIGGREIRYRSTDDLLRAYNLIRKQVEADSNPSLRRGRYNPHYS